MKHVLFVCTHNAGRSQMAQALFERDAPSSHMMTLAHRRACEYLAAERCDPAATAIGVGVA